MPPVSPAPSGRRQAACGLWGHRLRRAVRFAGSTTTEQIVAVAKLVLMLLLLLLPLLEQYGCDDDVEDDDDIGEDEQDYDGY